MKIRKTKPADIKPIKKTNGKRRNDAPVEEKEKYYGRVVIQFSFPVSKDSTRAHGKADKFVGDVGNEVEVFVRKLIESRAGDLPRGCKSDVYAVTGKGCVK